MHQNDHLRYSRSLRVILQENIEHRLENAEYVINWNFFTDIIDRKKKKRPYKYQHTL